MAIAHDAESDGNTSSTGAATQFTVGIPKQTIFLGMVAIAVLLALAFAITHWLNLKGFENQLGFRRLFHMDSEANLPAWYSSLLLFCASLLLGVIALAKSRQKNTYRRHWWALAAGFVWLSADESAQLHEMLNRPALGLPFEASGPLSFPWIALAIPMVALLGIVYLRFLRSLPVGTRNMFIAAAALYLGAAIGVEMLEGMLADTQGLRDQAPGWTQSGSFGLDYMMLLLVEETGEMLAIALFIRALLEYIDTQFARVTLIVTDGRTHRNLRHSA